MRSRADDQERILETSLVQNDGLLRHGGQDPWAGRALPWGYEGLCRIGLWEVRKREVSIDFHMLKRTYKIPDTRGLAIAKVILPSSKVLTLRWVGDC